MARDGSTSQPVTDAADPADMAALRALNASLEGRTEKLRDPHDESLLAWYAWIVARLGGWSGRTSRGYRPPGPQDHASWAAPPGPDPGRLAPGKPFRGRTTPVGS